MYKCATCTMDNGHGVYLWDLKTPNVASKQFISNYDAIRICAVSLTAEEIIQ